MTEGRICLDIDGAVATITIDNPDRRNAVSLAMWRQLIAAADSIEDTVRCVVVQGAGTAAFAAGADISEFRENRGSAEANAQYDKVSGQALARLHALRQPTIAKISGYCLGAGVAIALSCDMRIVSDTALFAVPAARLGLGYPAVEMAKLLNVVNAPVAKEFLFTARRFSATEAAAVGLVNRVCRADDLDGVVADMAKTIAANAPLSVRAAKATIRDLSAGWEILDVSASEDLVSACYESADYREGTSAFLEKRVPQFKGC